MRIRIPLALLFVVAGFGCSGGDEKNEPGFESLAELNARWTLAGTYQFLCDGSPVSTTITAANVYIFNGAFDAMVPWPAPVCGVGAVHLTGLVGPTGKIAGTAALPNGALSDSLSGSCDATSCEGETVNTTEFRFSMVNTGVNPFDDPNWSMSLNCQGGAPFSGVVSISGGQGTSSNTTSRICTDGASEVVADPVSETFTVSITPDGAFSASLTQGTAQTLSFATVLTAISASTLQVDGTVGGTRLFINRNDPD